MAAVKFGIGHSVRRKEDDALIRGKGRYTDDHAPPDALHALMLRSPHAHAAYRIDVSRARGLPGVALILSAADVADLGGLPCDFSLPDQPFIAPPYPILPKDEVRHVGDAIAFVVADTVEHARDALEAIEVDWTQLTSVVGVANAVKDGAPQVWPDNAGNILFDVSLGDKKAADAAFAGAYAVAEISIVNPRVVTNYMETRAAVCEYDAGRDHLTLTVGSQGSHRLREILCRSVLKIPMGKMRVICPDVGGGFGTKLFPYREYAMIAVASKKLHRTIKWTAERSDHFVGDSQGRDNVTTARMALAQDGSAQLREIASEALETSAADLEISDGSIRIAGTDRFISLADLAKRADPSKLTADESFSSADGTYPNGTHLVEVEIDPATGKIELVNYVVVRFRRDVESAAAYRPGPWRHHAGHRPGADGAGGL